MPPVQQLGLAPPLIALQHNTSLREEPLAGHKPYPGAPTPSSGRRGLVGPLLRSGDAGMGERCPLRVETGVRQERGGDAVLMAKGVVILRQEAQLLR